MTKKVLVRILIATFFLRILLIIYYKFNNKNNFQIETQDKDLTSNNSNIIQDVQYVSKDTKGNEYIINAVRGEIDFENNNVIFLVDVSSKIKLNNSNDVNIVSETMLKNVSW